MSGRRSHRTEITRWFAALSITLYAAGGLSVLLLDARASRRQLALLLYAEAEAVEACYEATGGLACQELQEPERHAVGTVWVRVVRGSEIVAAAPGTPALRVALTADSSPYHLALDGTWAVLSHPVDGAADLTVQAIAATAALGEQTRRLAALVALAGLLVVPASVAAGRLLAARALRPIERLVDSMRRIDTHNLTERLAAPRAVRELDELVRGFNQLLDRVELSVERMQRFTADASHELRTPIAILRSGLEVTLRRERGGEEYRAVLRDSLLEIERIQRIVEALLSLARLPVGGEVEANRQPVDFSRVVEATCAAVAPAAAAKGVRLEADVDGGVRVAGDPDRLRMLTFNLLDNALRLTPAGKHVWIRLASTEGEARLSVVDEGPGVAAADRPHVFERFYRGRRQPDAAAGTGGLGLNLARWAAEAHGGRVELVEHTGPGAEFRVSLPLLGEPAPA
jgi:signal transduction histidine kinase